MERHQKCEHCGSERMSTTEPRTCKKCGFVNDINFNPTQLEFKTYRPRER